jgi:hypothetical protein
MAARRRCGHRAPSGQVTPGRHVLSFTIDVPGEDGFVLMTLRLNLAEHWVSPRLHSKRRIGGRGLRETSFVSPPGARLEIGRSPFWRQRDFCELRPYLEFRVGSRCRRMTRFDRRGARTVSPCV